MYVARPKMLWPVLLVGIACLALFFLVFRGVFYTHEEQKALPDISKTLPSQRATRDTLIALLDPSNPNSIFLVVDALEANETLSLSCHEIAHDIGHRAYELYGFSGAMNFSDAARLNHASVQDVCAGGYVHGVLEEGALHQADFSEHPGALCADTPSKNRASCFHGVGHALMFTYNRNAHASLAGCRRAGGPNDASRCFEGVWMELFWGKPLAESGGALGWDPKTPLTPCTQTDADAKPACFLYASFGYLRTQAHDYAGAVRLCTQNNLSSSDEGFCLKGVGITMISHFKGIHLEQAASFVAGLSDSEKFSFWEGVLGYGRLAGVSEQDLEAACDASSEDVAVCKKALEASK